MLRKLAALLAMLHVALAVAGALHFRLPSLNAYTWLSGNGTTYNFFAPSVSLQVSYFASIETKSGVIENVDLSGSTAEASLRISGIADRLFMVSPDQQTQFVRSVAAHIFATHEDAQRVTVEVKVFGVRVNGNTTFPTMAEYSKGMRPEWITHYSQVYEKTSL